MGLTKSIYESIKNRVEINHEKNTSGEEPN